MRVSLFVYFMTQNFHKILTIVCIIGASMLHGAQAQSTSIESASKYEDLFDQICELFESSYPFEESEETQWTTLKIEIESGIDAIVDDSSFTTQVNRAFSELEISHLRLFDLADNGYKEISAKGRGVTGITLTWIQDRWLVHSITAEQNFDGHPVVPGMHITHIGPWELISDSSRFPMDVILQSQQANFGVMGNPYQLKGYDLHGNLFTATGSYLPRLGSWSRAFGNLSPLPLEFNVSNVEGVRIIQFNYFVYDLLSDIRFAIESTPKNGALVFDLRGNPGGMGIMANAIAGRLTDTSFQLGKMQMKDGWIGFFADPQPSAFLGPLAILIDEFSASTSEIFAQGMQESTRAKVFGRTSMGAALPSKFVDLSSHFRLQLPVAKYKSNAGYTIEDKGVIPDFIVNVTKQDLINQKDPVLSTAIQWIQRQLPFDSNSD